MTDYAPAAAADVTAEILALAVEVADDLYQDDKIDWEDVLDRMDRATLADGRTLDLGESMISPAIRTIKKHVRDLRKEG